MYKDTDKLPAIPMPTVPDTHIPGINEERIDYNKLKNKPSQEEKTMQGNYYALDIWQQGGTNIGNSFKNIKNSGENGDIEKLYSNYELVDGYHTNVKITKINPLGEFPIPIKKGQIIKVQSSFYSNGVHWKIKNTFNYRYLFGDNTILDQSRPQTTLLATSDGELDLQIASTGIFISAIFIQIL